MGEDKRKAKRVGQDNENDEKVVEEFGESELKLLNLIAETIVEIILNEEE